MYSKSTFPNILTLLKSSTGWLLLLAFLAYSVVGKAQCAGPVISTFPYNEGFESAPAWTTGGGGATNDWAWGTPNHPTINSAGGGQKCWCVGGLTGTFYNYGEHSYLESPCFDFTNLANPWISLKIFWEDEWRYDGMALQSSLDGGFTWTNVGAFGDPVDCLNDHWYDNSNITNLTTLTGSNPKNGWSGRIGATIGSCQGGNGSAGWVTAKHCLIGLANQPSVRFRFVFGAGTTCNSYDGIAIDDILIQNAPPNVANFSFVCTSTNTISFTNLSTPCTLNNTWNFGDPASGASNTSSSVNPSHTFSAPGTYTVTLTSSGSCNAPGSISIPVTISSAKITPQNVSCNGQNNGTATASVVGASGTFTYSWSPGSMTTATVNNLAPGTYTVFISGPGICPVSTTVTITQPTLLTASASSTPATCGVANGTATVSAAGGTAGYTYSWSPSGGSGATASNLGAGNYTCTVTDSKGCTTTASTTVGQPSSLAMSSTPKPVSCSGASNGSAYVTVSGGTASYTYSWSPVTGTTDTLKNLVAGTYTCLVKDASGCTFTATANVTQPAVLTGIPVTSAVKCNGGNTGMASVNTSGGNGTYTYSWTPGAAITDTIKNLSAGSYTCTVTDVKGCSTTVTATVTQPSVLVAPVTHMNVTCNGASTGWAIAHPSGGTSAYTYSWSPTGGSKDTASALAAGNYTVLVTDVRGCSVSAVVTIKQPAALSAGASSTPTTCGGNNGTCTATVSGGTGAYTYSWSPSGGSGALASGLGVGSYTCFVKDSNGCQTTASAIVSQPSTLSGTPASGSVKCNGGSSGYATIKPTGGTPAYTYSWSFVGATTDSIKNLPAGTYTCQVTDASGCIFIGKATVTQPSALGVAVQPSNITCNGAHDGSITLTVSGGTPGYTYSWSPGGTSGAGLFAQGPGNDTCFITDQNGCKTKSITTLTEPSKLTTTMSSVIANCSQSNGSATALVSGGTQPYSYSWSPSGGTGSTTTPVPSTLYTCFVTDAAGCVKKDTITVGHTTGVGASITGAHSICSGDSVLLTATGGGTYAWSTGATTATIYVKNTGNYTVTVTNGCGVTSATVAVLVYPPVTANFTADSLKGYAPLTVNFSNTSSGNATSWAWNFGDGGTATGPNQTHTYTSSGNFPATLTATDANGCSSTHIVIIVVHDIPSSVLVPNVFTPNGDGSNELFYIRSNGLAQLDVKIYDRWGVLMGQISTVNSGWDGRTKTGSQAADGTYYYVLSAKGADGKSFDKQGFFLLIR